MCCPTLTELSPPPPGKTGWPWTEENPQLPDTMPDGSPWPRVSIVMPAYNQAQFLEETIQRAMFGTLFIMMAATLLKLFLG